MQRTVTPHKLFRIHQLASSFTPVATFRPRPSVIHINATRTMSTNAVHPTAQRVLDFWLGDGWNALKPQLWFQGGPDLDAKIVAEFGADCEALERGDLDCLQTASAIEALAGIILGDQFFRNAHRGTAKMYAADPKVIGWAKALVESKRDKELTPIQRLWVNLPFMHSEELADQEECIRLSKILHADVLKTEGVPEALIGFAASMIDYGERHRVIVEKYGRFPHRNALVGRESTPVELQGLQDGTIEGF